jgi:pimeloyl-ACP methyl ester carboxylesterase
MKKTLIILFTFLNAWNLTGNSAIIVKKSGKGSPIVIIAGLGGTQAWQNTVQKLSVQNTCYLISIKGLSGDKRPAETSFPEVEQEILNFIHEKKLTKPMLIGHSFGGFLGMEIASANPGIFSKIVIVDAYPFGLALYNPAFTADFGLQQSRVLQNQLNSMPDPSYRTFWSHNVEQFTNDTISQKTILQKILGSEKKFVTEAQVYTLSTDLRPGISSIDCPVTVICSSYLLRKTGLTDEQIKERINQQFSNLEECNIFITNEAKHFIMIDSPGWFLEKILNKTAL